MIKILGFSIEVFVLKMFQFFKSKTMEWNDETNREVLNDGRKINELFWLIMDEKRRVLERYF